MSKFIVKDYIEEHREELEKNPNVKKVGKKITYTSEFKIKVVELKKEGYSNRLLFEENGLPYNSKVKNNIYRWMKQYDTNGRESFFYEERGKHGKSGRPKKKEKVTINEKVLIQEKIIEAQKKEIDALKKQLWQGKKVKINGNKYMPKQLIFSFIDELKNQTEVSIQTLCKYFKVSKSGYYKWKKSAPIRQKREEQDYADFLIIKETWLKHKKKHGYLRICMDLRNDEGIIMNPKKIYRIMRKYSIQAQIRKKNPYKGMVDTYKEHYYFENLLDRKFDVQAASTVFATDITYLIFNNHRYYLSVVKDLCTREIVAWRLSNNLGINLSIDIIKQLEKRYGKDDLKGKMIHSDQGIHYTNPLYVKMVKELEMIQSMSRRGNCIDNAKMETFFGHFKDECDYKKAKNLESLTIIINEYMEYYNHRRYQWTLKKMAPVQYRNHLKAA